MRGKGGGGLASWLHLAASDEKSNDEGVELIGGEN